MIKAVFFDLYHTLLGYDPPREELEAKALRDFGIDASQDVLRAAFVVGDEFIYDEHARSPISKRSEEDKKRLYARYQEIILKEAGIDVSEQLILGMLGKWQEFKVKFVLFDDVVPALSRLKERGITLGLISNVDHDINPLLDELGLPSLLQVVVTSQEVGFNKPKPEIFREALRQANVDASEAIFVGDQYRIDVAGANGAGMKGVLLDRGDYFKEVTNCPRIRSLAEVEELL